MHRSCASHAGAPRAEASAGHNELTFKNIDELRAFVLMGRKSRAGLEAKNLHLQAASDRNILDG